MGRVCYLVSFFFVVVSTTASHSQHKATYGSDDRQELYDSTTTIKTVSHNALVALISAGSLVLPANSTNYTLSAQSLADKETLCNDQRFLDQPAAATCAGVLVGVDRVLTAADCLPTYDECVATKFVFNFWYESANTLAAITADQVFACRRHWVVNNAGTNSSWALVQLDRPAATTAATTMSRAEMGTGLTDLVAVGFPGGVPAKVTTGVSVVDVQENIVTLRLDSVGDSRGMALLSSTTGKLVGFLTSNNNGYISRGQCFAVDIQSENSTVVLEVATLAVVVSERSPACSSSSDCPGNNPCLTSGCPTTGCTGFCDMIHSDRLTGFLSVFKANHTTSLSTSVQLGELQTTNNTALFTNLDVGDEVDHQYGIFSAPSDGIYLVSANILVDVPTTVSAITLDANLGSQNVNGSTSLQGTATSTTFFGGINNNVFLATSTTTKVTYSPKFTTAGVYAVYFYSVPITATATTTANYVITHKSGSTVVRANQVVTTAGWVMLGVFEFNAGQSGNVTVDTTTSTGATVIMDAVKFDMQVQATATLLVNDQSEAYLRSSNTAFSGASQTLELVTVLQLQASDRVVVMVACDSPTSITLASQTSLSATYIRASTPGFAAATKANVTTLALDSLQYPYGNNSFAVASSASVGLFTSGAGFQTTSSIFVAERAGLYLIIGQAHTSAASYGNELGVSIVSQSGTILAQASRYAAGPGMFSVNVRAIVEFQIGDTAQLAVRTPTSGMTITDGTYFSAIFVTDTAYSFSYQFSTSKVVTLTSTSTSLSLADTQVQRKISPSSTASQNVTVLTTANYLVCAKLAITATSSKYGVLVAVNGAVRSNTGLYAISTPINSKATAGFCSVVWLSSGDTLSLYITGTTGSTATLLTTSSFDVMFLQPIGLSSLVLLGGRQHTISTTVNLQNNIMSYDLSVPSSSFSVLIIPQLSDPRATLRVNSAAQDDGAVVEIPTAAVSYKNQELTSTIQIDVVDIRATKSFFINVTRECNENATDRSILDDPCQRGSILSLEASTGWCESFCLCFWDGIACTDTGNVLEMRLPSLGLTGTIACEFGALPALTVLDLHNNFLSGSIPNELGASESLTHVFLQNNFLEGDLPSTVSNSTVLQEFNCELNGIYTGCGFRRGDAFRELHDIDSGDVTSPWSADFGNELQTQFPLGYWKELSFVHLEGALENTELYSTTTEMFRVPPAFAPLSAHTFLTTTAPNDASNIFGRLAILVNTTGLVSLVANDTAVSSVSVRGEYTWESITDFFTSDGITLGENVQAVQGQQPVSYYTDTATSFVHLRGTVHMPACSSECLIARGIELPWRIQDQGIHLPQLNAGHLLVNVSGLFWTGAEQIVYLDGIVLVPSVADGLEDQIQVVELPLESAWGFNAREQTAPRAVVTINGFVCLSGVAFASSVTEDDFVIGTLPEGFRPDHRRKHAAVCAFARSDNVDFVGCTVFVEPAGDVAVLFAQDSEGESAYVSLSGICFGGHGFTAEVMVSQHAHITLEGLSTVSLGISESV